MRSSNSVITPCRGRAGMCGRGAPCATWGGMFVSMGEHFIQRLAGIPGVSAQWPAVLSDSQFAAVILQAARAALSWPLTHRMESPAMFICGRSISSRSSALALLNM